MPTVVLVCGWSGTVGKRRGRDAPAPVPDLSGSCWWTASRPSGGASSALRHGGREQLE